MKKLSLITSSIASLIAMPLLSAQDENPTINPIASGYTFDWNGQDQRSYFIQWSTDLEDFNYFPTIRSGTGNPLSHGFDSSAPKMFLRLKYTDVPFIGDVNDADFDGDNISNFDEIKIGGSQTDPLLFSTAGDGVSDFFSDSDGNGLADGWELLHNDVVGLFSADGDADGDGLSNLGEFTAGTDPNLGDTDGDGLSDGTEVSQSTDPLVNQFSQNPDTSGLVNANGVDTLSDLRAAWGFKSNSPSQFFDTSGRNFHATRFGSVVRSGTASGPVSHTASFNATGDYLKTSFNVTTNTGDGSVAFWFKANQSSRNRVIFSRDSGEFPLHFVLYGQTNAIITTNGVPSLQQVGSFSFRRGVPFGAQGGPAITVNTVNPNLLRIDDGEWHHVVLSFDNFNIRVFIDGVGVAAPTSTFFEFFDRPTISGNPSSLTGDSGFYFGK